MTLGAQEQLIKDANTVRSLENNGKLTPAQVANIISNGAATAGHLVPTAAWSNSLIDLVFPDAPSQKFVALSPTLGWESTAVQEPSVWYYNGLYHMIYTGGTSSPRLGYASSPSRMGPWTKNATAVLGGGIGGLAGGAYHAFVYTEGTTGYCYFVDSTDSSLLKLATFSLDTPTVLTKQATTWALPTAGGAVTEAGTLWGNVSVIKDGSAYVIAFECSTSAHSWQIGLGTMTSPTSAITIAAFPVASLRPSALNATATAGGPWLQRVGSLYVMYYHGGVSGSLPTYCYRATCGVSDLTAWTISNNGFPVINRSQRYEIDQVADQHLCAGPNDASWVNYWTALDNNGPTSYIMCAPGAPKLQQTVDGVAMSADNNANSIGFSNGIPQNIACASQATDVSTSSAIFADFALTSYVFFVPRTNKVKAELVCSASCSSSLQGSTFQVTDGGSLTGILGGTATPAAGGAQFNFVGNVILSVVPGQRYGLKVQAKISGGTLTCRPATQETERLTLSISDVFSPAING